MLDRSDFVTTEPLAWSASYEMYGERKKFYTEDLSNYHNYNRFKAKCLHCGQFTSIYCDSKLAVVFHMLHCAIDHGYVYAVDENIPVIIAERKFQEAITLAHKYALPMPGYDEHLHCIKKMQDNKALCFAHEDNYFIDMEKIKS